MEKRGWKSGKESPVATPEPIVIEEFHPREVAEKVLSCC
jgi:hypothetical protein